VKKQNVTPSRTKTIVRLPITALLLCLAVAPVLGATDPFLQLSAPVLTNGQVQFILTGESGVRYVIESSTNAQSWTPVVTNSDYSITRLITLPSTNGLGFYRAWRYPLPRFSGAITAKQIVSLHGYDVHFDSFDSADPSKSTNGAYDPAKAQANGDIASEPGLSDPGSAAINGKVKIGPSGSYLLGPYGYIGPIGWTGPGIYSPDWVRTDFRFALPPLSPPYSSGFAIPGGSGTNYTILGNANYLVNGNFTPAGSPKTILVVGIATLYVTGDFHLPSSWQIKIEPDARLRIYVGKSNGPASSTELSQVFTWSDSDAATFQYYGLPSNTSVIWNGNNAYTGVVYAPQATMTVGGGGSTVYDFQGAVVANSVVFNGHFNFHFDENLIKKTPQR